jgi:hypothetical protein
MIIWGTSSNNSPETPVKDEIVVNLDSTEQEAADDGQIIESQLASSLPVAGTAYGKGEKDASATPKSPEKAEEKKESKKNVSKKEKSEEDSYEETPARSNTKPQRNYGPVDLPAGKTIRIVLDENITSENPDMDGTIIKMHCDEDVVVEGRTVIKRGAVVTAKVVDVIPSTIERKKALVGFVIQKVQATDGSMVRLHSDRFRLFADNPGTPAIYRRGQTFTAELGRGRIN